MLNPYGNSKIFFLLIMIMCIAVTYMPGTANAADIYVDPVSGDDILNDGTQASPWQSLHRAATALAGNDVIHLLAGTYDSSIETDESISIIYSNITIQAETPGTVIIDGTGFSTWTICFDLMSLDNITLKGLTIQNFNSGGISIYMGTGSSVQACIIQNNLFGISISNNSAEISGNILYDNTTGIYLDNSDSTTYTPVVVNNLIYRGDINPMDTAISISNIGSTGSILNPIIYHNTIVGGNQDGIYLYNMGESLNADIKYNIITDFGQYAINNDMGSGVATIDYNDLYNNTSGNVSTGLTEGSNDIQADPQFSNPGIYDFHMTIDSPCVDTVPSAQNTINGDLDGYTRPQGAAKDMGCYEFLPLAANQAPATPTALSPSNYAVLPTGTTSVTLQTNPFSDPDGDAHTATTWKVWREDQGENNPIFTQTAVSGAGLTQQTVSELYSGMQYAWMVEFTDSQGNISSPGIFRFRIGIVTTQLREIPSGSTLADYRMVSVPKWTSQPLCSALFGHLPVEQYSTSLIRIGTYDIKTGSYVECGSDLSLKPGVAYWLLVRKGITLPVTGVLVNTNIDIERNLMFNTTNGNGWNMIAPPNYANYRWQDIAIAVRDNQGTTTFGPIYISELTDDLYIDRRIWAWQDGAYTSYPSTSDFLMEPGHGYWVKANEENVVLIFQESVQVADIADEENFRYKLNNLLSKSKKWLKNVLLYPESAIAENIDDTPPMPMNIDSEETSIDRCFITSLRFK